MKLMLIFLWIVSDLNWPNDVNLSCLVLYINNQSNLEEKWK